MLLLLLVTASSVLLALLAAPNHAGPNGARFLESVQDLGHAAVRHLQLSAYVARPHSVGRHLDDLHPDVLGQGAPIDEEAAQLVDAPLALVVRVARIVVRQEGAEVGRQRGHHGHACGLDFLLLLLVYVSCLAKLGPEEPSSWPNNDNNSP